MYNLFLIWDLDITPADKNIGEIKGKLNFEELKKYSLKNEDVYKHLKNKYCPELSAEHKQYIDIFYFKNQIDGYVVETRFFEITNTMLLTSSFDSPILKDAMKRHFQNFHDVITKGDQIYSHRLVKMIEKIEERPYYDLSSVIIPIKTRLFNYQLNNVNWMVKSEENKRIVQFTENKLIFFPDDRIYDYTEGKFTNSENIPMLEIRGGIIADEVGKGKTIQMLSLCFLRNIPTLILVPNHLKRHWENELEKHFTEKPDVKIISFSEFQKDSCLNIRRLIVDEIHTLYSEDRNSSLYDILVSIDIPYKWGLTATPITISNSIHKIFQYLTGRIINYQNVERYMYYRDLFQSLFKRNIGENIKDELELPRIHYHNHILNFNDTERAIYDSEVSAKQDASEMELRKYCCDALIDYQKDESLTIEQCKKMVVDDFHRKFLEETDKLNVLKEKLEIIKKTIQERIDEQTISELKNNQKHYDKLISEQETTTRNREIAYNLINNCLNDEEKECCICREEIKERDYCILRKCQHYFCKDCVSFYLKKSSNCPMCRQPGADDYFTVGQASDKNPYSTKFMELLKIIGETEGQIIVFTQFNNIIEKMKEILMRESISTLEFSDENIERFRKGDSKTLILSSKNNACGLDLSFVSNIIIFEPIKNSYVKDTEKQIIGRVSRINQKNECNVHRLIIKDTIEEVIYSDM